MNMTTQLMTFTLINMEFYVLIDEQMDKHTDGQAPNLSLQSSYTSTGELLTCLQPLRSKFSTLPRLADSCVIHESFSYK